MSGPSLGTSASPGRRTFLVGGLPVGEGLLMIAGPCAVESEPQVLETARRVRAAGANLLRGGAFKPRTSPQSFQGLGREGLAILARVREATGLPIVTEVLDVRDLDRVAAVADVLQIGSRNMQNFPLLREVGRIDKPVLLKRGMSATLEEWLGAAEYVLAGGNERILLCERGIRTFERVTRNTLDLAIVPLAQRASGLPVIVDPSHATGRADLIRPMCLAAVAAGADGLLVEVHPDPPHALSDREQQLTPDQFAELATDALDLARHLRRARPS